MTDVCLPTHDEAVAWARHSAAAVSLEQASDAFVASLMPSRDRAARTFLAAVAVARQMPEHSFQPSRTFSNTYVCGVCSYGLTHGVLPLDVAALTDQVHRLGRVLFFPEPAALGVVLDLAPKVAPVAPDRPALDALRGVFSAIEELCETARSGPAGKTFRKEALDAIGSFVGPNRAMRAWILETFGIVGILRVPGRPSFLDGFVDWDDRPDAVERNNELAYPTRFWRAADGLDRQAIARVFPQLRS